MTAERRYEFSWDLIGDIQGGRPHLGTAARLEVYRLMQFCFRDVVEQEYGTEAADTLFYRAGFLAGRHFYRNLVGEPADFGEFLGVVQSLLRELQIGILRIEEADLEAGRIVLTVAEDLDCSGLPVDGHEICSYDEGFIAALFEGYTGRKFQVREVDCWCTGDRVCRFVAQAEAE